MGHLQRPLPILEYDRLSSSLKAFHRFAQILGKIKLATVPPRNHWWHVALTTTARGFTTGAMPVGKMDFPDTFELEFDLINHRLKGSDSWGHSFIFSLEGLAVSEFYQSLDFELKRVGINVPILDHPYKLEPDIPFSKDDFHRYTELELMTNYFDSLRFADIALKQFAAGFVGKESPVHFFWHSLDLAMTRFNGKTASNPPDPDIDSVSYEAYTHEAISFGYWGGDERFPEAAFYSYTWPSPSSLTQTKLSPQEAFWHQMPTGPLAILPYESVRKGESPGQMVQDFYTSAYNAGCSSARWQKEELEGDDLRFNAS